MPVVYVLWLARPGTLMICAPGRRRQHSAAGIMFVLLIATSSCAGGGSNRAGGSGGGGQQSTKYTVTVTGTPGSLTRSTAVDLLITK